MNILVTGGAGFVGTNLVKKLHKEGHTVVVIDNYSAGKIQNHIDGVQYEVGHTKRVTDILENIRFQPEIIFHLGEYSKIAPSFEEIKKVFDFNIKGSFEVLEYVKKHNIPIIYAASSTKLATEGENHSPYSFFKSFVVQLLRNFATWYGVRYSICYFYNAYGEYQETWGNHWQSVIGVFEEQLRKGEPLTIVGDGQQCRDFTYVGDIVDGLIAASKQIKNEEYQLGSGKQYSILEVAQMFGGEIKFIDARPGDRRSGIADVKQTEQMLGWKAKKELKDWITEVRLRLGKV
jgi:UDP-glucose 4-epimerase